MCIHVFFRLDALARRHAIRSRCACTRSTPAGRARRTRNGRDHPCRPHRSAGRNAAACGGGAAHQPAVPPGVGETIRITVFQGPELSVETRITESGAISYPLLGSVSIAGLTVTEAEQRIARGLRDGNFVRQPQVSITLTQARGNQVSVLGQVGGLVATRSRQPRCV